MAPREPSVSRGMRYLAHIPKVQEVEGERKRRRKERRVEEGREEGRRRNRQSQKESESGQKHSCHTILPYDSLPPGQLHHQKSLQCIRYFFCGCGSILAKKQPRGKRVCLTQFQVEVSLRQLAATFGQQDPIGKPLG